MHRDDYKQAGKKYEQSGMSKNSSYILVAFQNIFKEAWLFY